MAAPPALLLSLSQRFPYKMNNSVLGAGANGRPHVPCLPPLCAHSPEGPLFLLFFFFLLLLLLLLLLPSRAWCAAAYT